MHLFASWVHWPNIASETKLLALPHYSGGRVTTNDCDAPWIEHAGESSAHLRHVLAAKLAK
jgi:hypothetical protein